MTLKTRCMPVTALVGVLVILAAGPLVPHAAAQTPPAQGQPTPVAHVVTGNDVYVRSGGGSSYYPFGRASRNDIVFVVGERFGWGRIHTRGHTFREMFGYVEMDKVRPAADGKTGMTLGIADVFAPNLDARNNPDSSWKLIHSMPAEQTVTILGIERGERAERYKIALPETAEGWISMQFLRPATEQELTAWRERVRREQQAASEPEPTDPPAQDPPRQTPPTQTPPTQTPPTQTPPPTDPPAQDPPVQTPPPADPPAQDPPQQDPPAQTTPPADPPADTSDTERRLAQISLDDLEAAYDRLREEPIRTAEIDTLRDRYTALAEQQGQSDHALAVARMRIELLDARLELQRQMLELDRIRARAGISEQAARDAQIAVELARDYTAIGRVATSTIYDGRRLPRLLRLIDPGSGRTLAYLEPTDEFDFGGMIGQLVGVAGAREYDGGLRLTVIQPRRIDLLTPRN